MVWFNFKSPFGVNYFIIVLKFVLNWPQLLYSAEAYSLYKNLYRASKACSEESHSLVVSLNPIPPSPILLCRIFNAKIAMV